MTYATPYISAAAAPLARVTWTPRGGSPVTVIGDYLTRWINGELELVCGIEELLDDLDLHQLDADHEIAVCELVNAQLRVGNTATVRCPDGVARLVV